MNTNPLIDELHPVAENLGPTLNAVQQVSPDLERLFVNLGPLVTASKTGFPALIDVLHGTEPLLAALGPFLEQLNPILDWLSLHQQLISDFISVGAVGVAAKTTTYGGNGLTCQGVPCGHYLRQFSPIGPQTSGLASTRDVNSRGNTYPPSLWLADPQSFSAGGKLPGQLRVAVVGLQEHRRVRQRIAAGDLDRRGVLGRADATRRQAGPDPPHPRRELPEAVAAALAGSPRSGDARADGAG